MPHISIYKQWWSNTLCLPNSSQGFWQVDSLSWSLGGTKKERSGNTTILDTGTTLLLVSDDVVEEIYGASRATCVVPPAPYSVPRN